MCQNSFDCIFDVLVELASSGELFSVSVTTVSGNQYQVKPFDFVEDNIPVRSHSTACLLLKQSDSLVHIDINQVESLTQQ